MSVVDDELDGFGRPAAGPALVRFSAIGEGWGLIMQRWPVWVLTVLIVVVCNSLLGGLLFPFFGVHPPRGHRGFWISLSPRGSALQFLLSTILSGLFLGGMFRMACRQIRGRPVGVETLFSVVDVLPQLILGSLLCGLATFVGLCLLVVPGFIVAGVLMFTIPLIVDGGLPATDALAQSWHALKSQWLVAAVFHMTAAFAAWVGVCFCGVGFLLTAPLYCTSIAVLYRDFFMTKSRPASFR